MKYSNLFVAILTVFLLITAPFAQAEQCHGNDMVEGKAAYSRLYQWYDFAQVAKDDAKQRFLNTSVGMEFIDLARSNRYYSNNIGQVGNYLGQIHHWMDGQEYQPVVQSKLDDLLNILFTDFFDTINHVNGLLGSLKDLRDQGAPQAQKAWYEREIASFTHHKALPEWIITCQEPEFEIHYVYETIIEDTSQDPDEEEGYPTKTVFEDLVGDTLLQGEEFFIELRYDIIPEDKPASFDFEVENGLSYNLILEETSDPRVFRSEKLVIVEPVQP